MGLSLEAGIDVQTGVRLYFKTDPESCPSREVTGALRPDGIASPMVGPVFAEIRNDEARFREMGVKGGTLFWASGADLCPDIF